MPIANLLRKVIAAVARRMRPQLERSGCSALRAKAAAGNGLAVQIIPKPLSIVRRKERFRRGACLHSHTTVGRPVLDACLNLLEEGFGQPVDFIAKHALVSGKVPVRGEQQILQLRGWHS